MSIHSCVQRFLRNGRYVDPLVIDSYGSGIVDAYNAAKATGLIDSSEEYSRGREGGFKKSDG